MKLLLFTKFYMGEKDLDKYVDLTSKEFQIVIQ